MFIDFVFLIGAIFWGNVLAQTAVSSGIPDWVSYLANGGPFAIVILLIVFDKLSTPGERDRLRNENDALRQEIKALNENIQKEIVPPLVRMNELMKDVIDELEFKRRAQRRGNQDDDVL